MKVIYISALLFSTLAYSQVGINTETPKATLDVIGNSSDVTKTDGLIAPRLTGNELKAKDGLYGVDQLGAIIYATAAASPVTTKTANVTAAGYYYFDGNVWVKFTPSATIQTEPWNVQGGTTPATANAQKIYQSGDVAIGKQTGASTLDVSGTFRSGDLHSGTVGTYSAILGGNSNQATGINAVVLGGSGNVVSGTNSVAAGNNNQALAWSSAALGQHVTASSTNQLAIGQYNAITTGTITNSVVATDAVFQVGVGASTVARKNALTILNNGNTGINITGTEATAKPTELLDIGGAATAGSGGVKIRNINSTAYTGNAATDKLVVADVNGVLKTMVNPLKPMVFGTLNSAQIPVASNKLIGHQITLPQGKWVIYLGELVLSDTAATTNNNLWMRLTLSGSNSVINQTGFNFLLNKYISGWLSPSVSNAQGYGYSYLTGFIPVEVTAASATLYLWFENCDPTTGTPPVSYVWSNGENFIFAVPAY